MNRLKRQTLFRFSPLPTFMKLNPQQLELKSRLEKLGVKAYFKKNTVRIFWPKSWKGKVVYTYREAYNLAKDCAGGGKSVRPWLRVLNTRPRL